MSSSRRKIVFCWSGGKDSALALNRILREDEYEVVALLTTCHRDRETVAMHSVPVELLERQAASIGIPLVKMFVSPECSNQEYLELMNEHLSSFRGQGIEKIAFGDLFLEDLRLWRESFLGGLGMQAVFPLWKENSRSLIDEFIRLGFGSIVCCIDDAYLDESYVGRRIDEGFVASLPTNVDPCGENGEYHSFVFSGPIFNKPLKIEAVGKRYRRQEVVEEASEASCRGKGVTKGFWLCDLRSSHE